MKTGEPQNPNLPPWDTSYLEPRIPSDSLSPRFDYDKLTFQNNQIPLRQEEIYSQEFEKALAYYLFWLQSLKPVDLYSANSKASIIDFAIYRTAEELEHKRVEESELIEQLLILPEFEQFYEELEGLLLDLRENIYQTRLKYSSTEIQIGAISEWLNISLSGFAQIWQDFIDTLEIPYEEKVLRIFKRYCFYKIGDVVNEGYIFIESISDCIQLLLQTGLTKQKSEFILEIIYLLPQDIINKHPELQVLSMTISKLHYGLDEEVQAG